MSHQGQEKTGMVICHLLSPGQPQWAPPWCPHLGEPLPSAVIIP